MLLALFSLLLAPAHATWSIAAVDPDTGEVGAAGATCGPMVWFIAGLVPGEGVMISQYATWRRGREEGEALLAAGRSAAAVIAAVRRMDDDDAIRQYGVVPLDGPPATFTGDGVEGPALTRTGAHWSVQGNTLADRAVVEAAAAAMEGEGALEDRLLAALVAGAAEGGDARCDPQDAAKSAFLYVADPGDRAHAPRVEHRTWGAGAVAELEAEVKAGQGCAQAPAGGLLGVGLLAVFGRRRRTGG